VTSESDRQHFEFLDGLRGLACLAVVLNHVKIPILEDQMPAGLWTYTFHKGGLGVLVFFVLSGYVIAYSLRSTDGSAAAAANFMERRTIRITPPYYVALVVSLVVSGMSARLTGDEWFVPDAGNAVAHLLYLPGLLGLPMINGIYWTLYIEMQFYLAMCVVIWALGRARGRSRHAETIVLSVVAAIGLAWPLLGVSIYDPVNGLTPHFLAYWYSFLLGAFIFWFGTKRMPPGVFWTFVALLVTAWIIHRGEHEGAALVAGALILAAQHTGNMGKWFSSRPVQFLGAISFSLYLVHMSVLGTVAWAGNKVLGESALTDAIMIVPGVLASIAAGYVVYRLVERPSIRWSRGIKRVTSSDGKVFREA
jgi:peptidoglycan/LPS O-acetylase OafA/YrhL